MFLNGYPYTDFHELNLDFLLKSMEELKKAFASFTASNSLIFAEPLLHDLTSTYAKNTIVLDPDGNAYISLQAVPAGVQLSNADYWLMVFNFEEYTEKANKNFTVNYLRDTTRAPQAYAVGDWLVLDDVLYKVTSTIASDELLVIGTNIVHFTVEQFLKDFITTVNNTLSAYSLTIQQYKNDIDASELAYRQQLAQDIATTTANLQAQLELAISGATVDSEVINARLGADGVTYPTLGDAIRTQLYDLTVKVDEGEYLLGEKTGNLFDYRKMTTDNITISEGVLSGTSLAFKTAFENEIPIDVTFDSNTVYTLAATAKNTGGNTSGNGIFFRVYYTDDTFSTLGPFPNSTTTFARQSVSSTSGKTVSKITMSYSSDGTNTWEVKDISLYKGTSTEYQKPIIADDPVARKTAQDTSDALNIIEDYMYEYTHDYAWSQGRINATTGADQGSDLYVRTAFIEDNVVSLTAAAGYHFSIYGYSNNTYVGYLTTSDTWSTSGSLKWMTEYIISDAPYDVRIVCKKTNNQDISPDEAKAAIEWKKFRFATSENAINNEHSGMLAIRKLIPDYYFATPETPDSFAANDYLNQKIASIPTGKHFIFITDPHWKNNNTKKSTELLRYVKNKTGIKDIFQGGDILNQELSKYEAKAQMSLYMNEMIDAFGDSFICVQGNHDKNVANLNHVLEDHPELSEYDVALPYDVIYNTEMAHFAGRVHFANWDDWLVQTGATGDALKQLDAYRKMHFYLDDDEQKIRYIVVCATNTSNNGVVRQYFGAVSLNECDLQYEWFRDVIKATPDKYDVVVLSHVIINDTKDGSGTWLPYDQIAYYMRMMGAMQTRSRISVRNIVSTSSPEGALLDTFFASGAHTFDFTDVTTDHDVMFILGGDCHCDDMCYLNSADMTTDFVESGESVSLSTGIVPGITTLCDACAVPSVNQDGVKETMTVGTITEQCFEVVTITPDKKVVLTRFGAGEDRYIQIV